MDKCRSAWSAVKRFSLFLGQSILTQLGYRFEKNSLKLKPYGPKWFYLILQLFCVWLSLSSWGETDVKSVLENILGTCIAYITLHFEHRNFVNIKSDIPVNSLDCIRIDDAVMDSGSVQSPFGIRMMLYAGIGVFAGLTTLIFWVRESSFNVSVINFASSYIGSLETICSLLVLLFDAEPA